MKSYVPKDTAACPSDVSLIVRSYDNDCNIGNLSLELENKGLFNVSAYIIRGSTDENRELANISLVSNSRLNYDLLPVPLNPEISTAPLTTPAEVPLLSFSKGRYNNIKVAPF